MPVPLTAACVAAAALAFGVVETDLWSIFKVEGGRVGQCCAQPDETGKRTCGSDVTRRADCGPFQLNQLHAEEFGRIFGAPPQTAMERLRDDGCLNAYGAAYLLAQKTRQGGGDREEGVGRYHSATPELKAAYQRRIAKARARLFGAR